MTAPAPAAVVAEDIRLQRARALLQTVPDPEVPAVSIHDLGMVRAVHWRVAGDPQQGLEVVLTPTYSGCPATEAIAAAVREALQSAGLGPVQVTLQRSPAWSTDWITERGRAQLRAAGIAPPGAVASTGSAPIHLLRRPPRPSCPQCGSSDTEQLAPFGSTACKALHRCRQCREPFEYFKPI